ncbi:MAG: 1,4-alpha-glucan branching enzyme, partial [Verrucomicrobia bacterium]|nr:1,4-alpha-glucan branching enzyme [Verrucomicrobiota bacterium]
MLLTPAELESLTRLLHQSPHSLLGMQPLGDGSGLVARAMIPDAVKVEVVPVHDRTRPKFALKRLGDTCVFEGVTRKATFVYAYDPVLTDSAGRRSQGRDPYSFLPTVGETDQFLFNEGNHQRLYDVLGAHLRAPDGVAGTAFAVWAPNARRVSVVGDFNQWDGRRHPMRLLGASGIWEVFVPGIAEGALYQFEMTDAGGGLKVVTDPLAAFYELPPKHAAVVWDTGKFVWDDADWMRRRSESNPLRRPMSIYEVHLGSWRR